MSVIGSGKSRTQRVFESIKDFPSGKRINRCNLSVLKLSKACLNSV